MSFLWKLAKLKNWNKSYIKLLLKCMWKHLNEVPRMLEVLLGR